VQGFYIAIASHKIKCARGIQTYNYCLKTVQNLFKNRLHKTDVVPIMDCTTIIAKLIESILPERSSEGTKPQFSPSGLPDFSK
jgi:hypothetical protein